MEPPAARFKLGPPDGARARATRPSRHAGDHRSADGGKHANRVESILRRSGPGSHSLVASQVSLGEAAAVILRRGPGAERMLEGMLALLADCRVGQGRYMLPLNAGVFAAVNEMVRLATELDMADRAILAHALADPDSAFFITKDQIILSNDGIRRYEKESSSRVVETSYSGLPIQSKHAPPFDLFERIVYGAVATVHRFF